jgi:hypothetical protein
MMAVAADAAAGDLGCGKPQPVALGRKGQALKLLRIFTGADGKSHAEESQIAGTDTTYLGLVLTQFGLGDPSNVVIVRGPAGLEIVAHKAPYREIFILLSGSSVVLPSGGGRHELSAGSIVLFEDVTGEGHGGRIGPCGYVALDLQFKAAAPAPAPTH